MPESSRPPSGVQRPASRTADEVGNGEIHRPVSDAYARTWELELIISGAVLYALVQLPGWIDRWYLGSEPHLAGATRGLVAAIYYYAKLACYTLGAAFVIHLAARAYWVGLLGLDTAFPQGVRWEKLGQPPITLQVYRDRQPPLERLIQRVDRFCSVIFSFAFVVVFLFVYSVLAFMVLGIVAIPISALLFDGERLGQITKFLALALFTPVLLGTFVDHLMKDRLDRSRGLGRAVYRVSAAFYSISLGVTYLPVFNVLLSNVRKAGFYAAFATVFVGVVGLFVVKDALLPTGRLAVSGYEYLPDVAGSAAVDYLFYADMRRPGERPSPLPTVQSQTIREPFVRLFVPYIPRRHGPAIERACGGVQPLGGTGPRLLGRDPPAAPPARVQAVLDCLERIHPVRLNGEPVDPGFRLYTDPASGRRGVVAFLPVEALPPGENRLTVGAVADAEDPQAAAPHEIPFWVDARPR